MELQQPSVADRDVEEAYAKRNMDFVESAADASQMSNFPSVTARLSKPHRDFLIERHGTLDLDPIPAMDPADPYNWPEWKVGNLTHTNNNGPSEKTDWSLMNYDACRKQ